MSVKIARAATHRCRTPRACHCCARRSRAPHALPGLPRARPGMRTSAARAGWRCNHARGAQRGRGAGGRSRAGGAASGAAGARGMAIRGGAGCGAAARRPRAACGATGAAGDRCAACPARKGCSHALCLCCYAGSAPRCCKAGGACRMSAHGWPAHRWPSSMRKVQDELRAKLYMPVKPPSCRKLAMGFT